MRWLNVRQLDETLVSGRGEAWLCDGVVGCFGADSGRWVIVSLPNPIVEREARSGQEGFVHYLFTCLLLGCRPPGGNKPARLSGRGLELLSAIDTLCFGGHPGGEVELIWEMRLEGRTPDEGVGYPDLGVVSAERLLLFELKTQPGSAREGQVEGYLQRGLHHHPDRAVDLVYLTRDPTVGEPPLTDRSRYANCTWSDVVPLIEGVWPAVIDEESALAQVFAGYLSDKLFARGPTGRSVGSAQPTSFVPGPSAEMGPVPVADSPPSLEAALAVAGLVVDDGVQRVYEYPWPSREHALAFRAELREAAKAAGVARLDAWVWRPESTGKPLTATGMLTGVELRMSRLKA